MSYSDVQGGQAGIYVETEGTLNWGSGNIAADPLFVNATGGDVRLSPGSPCIDAGSNEAVPADSADLDGDGDTTEPIPFDLAGNPRFVDDPNTPDTGVGTPPIVDMGAYEYQGIPCDLDIDGDVDVDDYWIFGDAFGQSTGSPEYNPACDFDGDGTVTLVDYQMWLQCYRDFNG